MGKKILTLDIGASRVVLAEFESSGKDSLSLVNYGTAALAAPLDSGNPDTILSPALMEIVREKGIKPGPVALSVSGQMVFPRFAAIPMAGGSDKFEQMVRYEVEQNIPFPIDDMVFDRQVLGDTEAGDKSVMIVAAKLEQIKGLTDAVVKCGFKPTLVDVAPIAVTNAVRWVTGDAESSSIILDIGAKTTSLIIAEGEKLFIRAIPIGGNNIDRDIGQALGVGPDDARALKVAKGYVAQGGVTEDEDAETDRISKICRAVLTRLHAEVSRSVNFSRSQQGFSAPTRLYLTGGTALLGQLDAFFAESLGIEVVTFNPFDRIEADAKLDENQLATDAVLLASAAGAAVHELGGASLQVNLIPPEILIARAEKAKIPVVAAGGVMLIAALACAYVGLSRETKAIENQQEEVETFSAKLKAYDGKIKAARDNVDRELAKAQGVSRLLENRSLPVRKFRAFQRALGDKLWIDSWTSDKDGDRVTIRGWKDKLDKLVSEDAKGGAPSTASEIVMNQLKNMSPANGATVDPKSLKISGMTTIGSKSNVEQFTVEVKFQ